jgi:hypothetical protein
MSTTADDRPRPFGTARSTNATSPTLAPATLAWIALLPSACLGIAAIVLLGPPLGDLLFRPGSDALWPPGWWEATGHAEPTKHARYLLAVLAPLLPAGVVLVGTRATLRLSPRIAQALSRAAQALVLAIVALFLLRQNVLYNVGQPAPPVFGVVNAAVALALVATIGLAMRRATIVDRVGALVHETPRRRVVALVIALLLTATWLLKVLMTDRLTGDLVGLNIPFTMNDASAVLNGRTPLVDYHPIYAKLLPFSTALVFAVFGSTIFVFTAWMAILDGLALIAVYAVFRLVARKSVLALLLFAPFLATSDLGDARISAGAITPLTFPAMWPMRYGGAYLLAWLTARHLTARSPRRAWLLFLMGGVIVVDNLEFGLGAMLATIAALLCARPPRSLRAALGLGAHVAIGALGAVSALCVLTLARAGALPDFALLFEWPRIFSTLGWFSMPLPATGLHLVLYATFAAAIVVAAVRLAQGAEDALLTGMLAWSGVFGLLAGGYFVGRPDTYKLDGMLSAWCFALALLTVLVVRGLMTSGWRRPAVLQLLVLFGFGLAVCSLARFSLPHDQIARLTKALPEPRYEASVRAFVAPRARPGETVALLVPMGHRIAHDLGLRNVSPYPFMNAIVTQSQMQTLVDTLRREHVRRIFTAAPHSGVRQEGDTAVEQLQVLGAVGYRRTASEAGIVELTHLRAATRTIARR